MKQSWLLTVLLLAACSQEPADVAELRGLPVVVYAAYQDKTYLPELFKDFTRDTGWPVVVRNGTAAGIVEDVLQDRVVPPADVLLTPSVIGVWRAAEEGQLRPNYSPVVADVLPWLRDPDHFWVALSYRNATIVYSGEQFSASELSTYETLAEPTFRRKLCLSTSALSINRAVLARMMQKLGVRETELVVRSWVANLALPPFAREQELMQALASGQCLVAIVSSDAAQAIPDSKLKVHTPIDFYSDIEGLGITRHARNPDGAAALVEWLLDEDVQRRHAEQMSSFAAAGDVQDRHNISVVASGEEEARLLAERARYY